MAKVYLLVYGSGLGDRENVKAVLDRMPEVVSWRYDLPSSFYVVSNLDAKDIATALRANAGDQGRLLLVPIEKGYYGWLPKETWAYIKKYQAQ